MRSFARRITAAVVAVAFAHAAPPGKVANKVPPKLESFDYGDVHLLPGSLADAFETNARYLRSLDPERLLANFRLTAGLPTTQEGYGGWEAASCELRGHYVGHYLSACARTVRVSGDVALKRNADAVVAGLAEAQSQLGTGYVGAFPATLLDRVEAGQPVWAPYYTLHKLLAGLIEMERYAGNAQALDVATKLADYLVVRAAKLDDAAFQRMLDNEFGGMAVALYDLHARTGRPEYLALARRFEKRSFMDEMLNARDGLAGLHANTHLPQIEAAARRYELTGEERYRKAVEFFWTRVATTQSFVTGGSSDEEFWVRPNELSHALTPLTQEFCTSFNWELVTRTLLEWSAEARYGDMYERAFYNGLLVAQQPKTGMFAYMLPLNMGARKRYSTPETTFTCCCGTGAQQYATLGEAIYFHAVDALYVNLYAASSVDWNGVTVTQRTRFPEETTARFEIKNGDAPKRFALMLRVPEWARQGFQVAVNGARVDTVAKPSTWFAVEREWRTGDVVTVELPATLWTAPINDNEQLRAVLYGPVVLGGIVDNPLQRPNLPTPVFTGDTRAPQTWIVPVAGPPLTFKTQGQPENFTLLPLYALSDESYNVYWRFASKKQPEVVADYVRRASAERAVRSRVIDHVIFGDAVSERAHSVRGEFTPHYHRAYARELNKGGWVSCEMRVAPGLPVVVAVLVEQGPNNGAYRITVNGQKLEQRERLLTHNAHEVELRVPASLTAQSPTLSVRVDFDASPGRERGYVGTVNVLMVE